VALIEVYDLNQSVGSKLADISTRAFVSTGDNVVIAGFILGHGGGLDRIVIRGIGPSLSDSNSTGRTTRLKPRKLLPTVSRRQTISSLP
jgi:hypothetical protein